LLSACSSVDGVQPEPNPTFASAMPGPADPAPPPQVRTRPHRWGFGAFVVVEVAYVAVGLTLLLITGRGGATSVVLVLALIAGPTVAAALLAVLLTTLRGNGPRRDLHLQWSWRNLGWGLLFGFAGLFITLPASMVYMAIVGPDANSAVGEAFGGLRTVWPWAVAVFLCVVLVAPVCEEIIFRGLLWGAVDWRWGRWAAFGVTTVIFAHGAAAHRRTADGTRAPLHRQSGGQYRCPFRDQPAARRRHHAHARRPDAGDVTGPGGQRSYAGAALIT
jgi:membrane protease YdiL (CAAX protease family)